MPMNCSRSYGALAVTVALLFGMAPSWATDPTFALGSHVGLVPPAYMVPGKTFQGFEDRAKEAIIVINELPEAAYSGIERSFRPEELRTRGIEVISREDVTLKNGRGFLVVARREFA